MHETK